MNLVALQMDENQRKLKMTVLHRPGGIWHQAEVGRLVTGLRTAVSGYPDHPEYLVVFGHHTKEETLRALGGGVFAYTATQQVVGTDHEDLPFIPGFA